MIIDKIQLFSTNLFQINCLVSYQILIISNSEISYIEVWFTEQHSKPPKRENTINITLTLL